MDWDNIRCFIEVAERKSFNAAAEHLSISVATVARRITALENELKLTLVERGPVGVTLTCHVPPSSLCQSLAASIFIR